MLVELEDGSISIIDANRNVHESTGAEGFMAKAREVLEGIDLPPFESAPASGPTVQERHEAERLNEAFGTLGSRLRDVAAAEYGAPLVDAASTVVGHAGKTASSFLKKLSRRKGGPRSYMRRRS